MTTERLRHHELRDPLTVHRPDADEVRGDADQSLVIDPHQLTGEAEGWSVSIGAVVGQPAGPCAHHRLICKKAPVSVNIPGGDRGAHVSEDRSDAKYARDRDN